jgi:hypothetical protein
MVIRALVQALALVQWDYQSVLPRFKGPATTLNNQDDLVEPSSKFQPYLQGWGPRNCYIAQHSNALSHLLQKGFVTNLTFSTQGRFNFTNQGVQEILSWWGDVPPPPKTSAKCSPKCCSMACGLGSGTLKRSRMHCGHLDLMPHLLSPLPWATDLLQTLNNLSLLSCKCSHH